MYPLILLLVLPGQMKDEPTVGGKPMRFWIDELKNKNPLHREEALAVLAEMGETAKDALPQVEKLLEDDRTTVRRRAALAVWKLGGPKKYAAVALAEEILNADPFRQQNALQELTKLGPDAAPAIPVLLPLLESPEPFGFHTRINTFIQGVGKAAIPVLIETLEHKDAKVRARAAFMLSLPANRSKDHIPVLQKRLDDADSRVKRRVAWALWENEDRGDKVLTILVEGFAEEEPTFRQTILQSLVKLEPKPKAAAEIYKAALQEKDLAIKVAATAGLWDLNTDAKAIVPALKEVLTPLSFDPQQTWRSALPVIRRMGPEARELVPELIVRLRGPEGQSSIEIGLALMDIGEPAVEQLMDLLGGIEKPVPPFRANQKNPALHPMLALILAQIGKPAIAEAMDRIGAMNPRVRESACRVLAVSGSLAKPGIPKLREALKDSDVEVQRYAAEALGNLEQEANEAADDLVKLAGNENPDVRLAALKALTRLKTDPKLKRDLALQALKDTTIAPRVAAIELLGQADPKHPDLLPALVELIGKDATHSGLFSTIRRMGTVAKDAVPALVKLFDRKDGTLAVQVVETLSVIGKNHPDTAPALIDVLRKKVYSGGMQDTYAALHALGVEDKSAIPVLIGELRYANTSYPTRHLFELLARFKGEAKDAAKELTQKARYSFNYYERVLAAKALEHIDPEMLKTELLPILKEQSSKPRGGGAALVLWQLDPKNKEALEALGTALKNDLHDRHALLEALGRLGLAAKDALPLLEAHQKSPEGFHHLACATAISRITGKSEPLEPVLSRLLQDLQSGGESAWKTARLLEEIGPPAKAVVPALLLLSRHTSPGLSASYERALRSIDPEAAARVGVR